MNLSNTKKAVMACVSYFDVFHHPLTKSEIHNFLTISVSPTDFDYTLNELVKTKHLFFHEGYYLKSDKPDWVANRLTYEKQADEKVSEAKKYGNLIRKFPFVKAVCISGSMSKHIMKEDSDIDFFIMGKANRIWIAKLFLKCYKFLFLKNSRETFCINYFISQDNLYIKEQNQYTATELATLIPFGDEEDYKELMRVNGWYRDHLPNFDFNTKRNFDTNEVSPTVVSKMIESFFWGKWGRFVDTSIMKYNNLRNQKKYANLKQDKDFELMLRATENQIKVHNSNHQMKTLNAYKNQLERVEKSFA